MHIKKNTIKLSSTGFAFALLFPHFKPSYFDTIQLMDIIYNTLRIISAITIIIIYLFYIIKKKSISKNSSQIIFILITYYVEIFISTISNKVELLNFIQSFVSQMAVFLICIYFLSTSCMSLINSVFYIAEILVYTNFFTLLLYPNGLYATKLLKQNWLLGFKNSFFTFFIGFYMVAFLYSNYKKAYVRSAILITVMFISLILANSSTSIISFTVFIVMVLLVRADYRNLINSVSLTIVNIVLFLLIVVFRILDVFSFIIVDLLHKSVTLTGRTGLWDKLYILFSEKPIFGYGYVFGDESAILTKIYWGTHAHNALLECLYVGGAVCLIIYCIFNAIVIYRVYNRRNTYTAHIIAIGLFVFNIANLTEYYSRGQIFILFGLASCIDYLVPYERQESLINIFKCKRFSVRKRRYMKT